MLWKCSRQWVFRPLGLGAHGCPAPSRALNFLHALGVEAHRDDGAVAHVIFDGDCPAGVFQVFLHHGKTCPGAAYIPLHLAVCAGDAKVEGALFVVDARTLVGKADSFPAVQDRDNGLGKVGVDKVFDNLADNHERDVSALLFHALVDGVSRLFQIRADVLRLDDDHARGRKHVVIDGDARRIHGFRCLFRCLLALFALFAYAVDVLVVGCRVTGIDHGVKVVRHAARNLSKGFG